MQLISEADARRLISMGQAIEAIEAAFLAMETGAAQIFPVALGHGSDPRNRFAVKSGLFNDRGLLGLKIGAYWPENSARDLESHSSTTLLLDDATGRPKALVSASYLTAIRTAAADGVACRHLSRLDSEILAVVGAGHQAWFEILAVSAVRAIKTVLIWGRDAAKAEALALRVRNELDLQAQSVPIETAVSQADILITVTAAQEPLIRQAWLKPGVHISAMGADAPGKQELDIDVVTAGRLFADVAAQSRTIGEFQAAARVGLVPASAVTALGAVIRTPKLGRRNRWEATVFDSSGIALQDLAVADLVLNAANANLLAN